MRGSLFIAIGLTVLQQVTGINTIIYYGPQIFELAGSASHASAIFATLMVAIVNVVATVVGIALVDRIGLKAAPLCWRNRHDSRPFRAFLCF